MSSLFGERLDVTQDGIDFVMASTNKCLQGIPGVSFVIARRSAVEALKGRAPRTVYLDLYNHYVQQEADNTPFTPAVQVLHAMEQALVELETEGVANRVARYAEACLALRDGMAELGFQILVPMLELSERVNDVGWASLTCNTEEELKYNLGKLRHRRGYGILYLSCHGRPGELVFDKDTVEIEKLGQFLGDGFTNWVVHFGSCATLNIAHARISRFIANTRVSMVIGYRKDVDWIDSAAIDLLLFDRLQEYRSMHRFWEHFRGRYRDLISLTGLRAFLR